MATTAVSSSTSATTSAASTNSTSSTAAANKANAQKIMTSLGAGSGVDTASLAQNLVDAERLPRENAINEKIAKNDKKVTGLSAVMFMMNELKTKLTALKDKSSFNAISVSNSNANAFSATASTAANVGNHQIEVVSLAKAQRTITTTGFASGATALNGGAAFNLKLTSDNPGVVGGTFRDSNTMRANVGTVAGGTISNASFAYTPTVGDFTNFAVTVSTGGAAPATYNITPAPATATMADLAANLQTQLQAASGNTSLSVSYTGRDLVVASTNVADVITAPALTAAPLSSPAYIAGAAFGTIPAVTDFKRFSLSIDGVPRVLTPAPATASLADLAANLESQLQTLDGSRDINVAVSGTELVFTSASGRRLTNPELSKTATIELQPTGLTGGTGSGAAGGVTTGTSSGATLIGASFGTVPTVNDFKSFKVTIAGVTHVLTPAPATPSMADLAANLQSQIRALEGTSDISITTSGSDLTLTSATSRAISGVGLSAARVAGPSFATAASVNDFKGFGIAIGGVQQTIIPAPTTATLKDLAANIQSQIQTLEGTTDITVTASAGGLQFWSASGRTLTSPVLLPNAYDATPDGVVKAINAKNLGVTAELVNTGNAVNPYQIVLNGAIGSTQGFTLGSDIGGGAPLGTLTTRNLAGYSASDAVVVVNGVSLNRSSNVITDAIAGVTLSLNAATTGTASLNLSRDTTAIKTKMSDLVTAYNDAADLLKQVSDPKSTLETYGATLVGNSTVRMVQQQLRGLFQGNSSTPGATVNAYWQLGFSLNEAGVMSLDANKLDTALNTNYSDVVKAMTGNREKLSATSTLAAGLAGDGVKKLTDLLASSGPIVSQSENANTQNTKYKDELAKLQTRMAALLTRYTKQFAAMDSLVGQVNSQKTSLKSSFEGMMAMYTNK